MLTSSKFNQLESRAQRQALLERAIATGKHYVKAAFHPNSLGAHTGVIGTAIAAGGSKRVSAPAMAPKAKRAKVSSVVNVAGPGFNPGGTGGFVKKDSKGGKKKKKVKAAPLSASVKKTIKRIANQVSKPKKVKLSEVSEQNMFAVFTGDATPIDVATTPISNNKVGWYSFDTSNSTIWKAAINSTYRSDAYAASGTTIIRQTPFTATAANKQTNLVFYFNQKYKFRIKNNTSQPAIVDHYALQCHDDTSQDPITELETRYQQAYIDGTSVVTPVNAQSLKNNFSQYWTTPRMQSGNFHNWKINSHRKIALNPGDEMTMVIEFNAHYVFDSDATTYPKGSWSNLFRIQGSLSHSEADARIVHWSAAAVDVCCDNTRIISMKEVPMYNAVPRRLSTAGSAFVDDVVAGDATKHVTSE